MNRETEAASDSDATPGDTRPYIHVRPTGTPLDPQTIAAQFERLHGLVEVTNSGASGIRDALFETTTLRGALALDEETPVRLEVLLVAPGGPEPALEYYLGCEPVSQLERIERSYELLFPGGYELTRRELSLTDRLSSRSTRSEGADTATVEDTEADAPTPVRAIQWTGRGERRQDWQTRLTPYAAFEDAEEGRSTAPPLAEVASLLANAPYPAVYQALAEPFEDYTWAVELREDDLKEGVETWGGKLAALIWGTPSERKANREAKRRVEQRHRRHSEYEPSSYWGDYDTGSTTSSDSASERNYSRFTESRLADLETKDATHAFAVTARAVVCEPPIDSTDHHTAPEPPTQATDGGPTLAEDVTRPPTHPAENARTAETAASESGSTETVTDTRSLDGLMAALCDVLEHAGGEHYHLEGRETSPEKTWAALLGRDHAAPDHDRFTTWFPWTQNRSACIVTDPSTLGLFTLCSGATLPEPARRALAPTPAEQRALEPLSAEQVKRYRTTGFTLGRLLDHNDEPGDLLALPPALQSRHTALFAPTGAGKSTLFERAIVDNRAATDGADIAILPKGDGMADELLKAHFARYGTLDDVYYFDCADVLPAMGFFDIRADLEVGISRETAVDDRITHYVEIVKGLMGADAYGSAKRSTDVLTYLLRALFDPVNGSDAFSHAELVDAVARMTARQAPPPVIDDDLAALLEGVVANRGDSFDAIMQGVSTRIEKVPADRRLARLFGYVATTDSEDASPRHVTVDEPEPDSTEPRFDLDALLNERATIIIDTGSLRGDARRAITLVVLSQLWAALRRRAASDGDDDRPFVNCYIEEAATVADTGLLGELLSQSRSFGLGITLAMQFPRQLQTASQRAYDEVLNDVGTILAGPVQYDPRLAERLATDEIDATAMAARLRRLRAGQWLATLPAPFGSSPPQPCLLASPAPPRGHPASDEPLDRTEQVLYEAAAARCLHRTVQEAGLPLSTTQRYTPDGTPAEPSPEDDDARRPRVDTPLPYTTRFPRGLRYDAERHAIVCARCESTYDPDAEGMRRALACHPRGRTDPDDVPITELTLKLSPTERHHTGYTDAQLMFLQAVYNAQQGRYRAPEFDLVFDTMLRLQEYVGIDTEAVDELLDAGVLRHDGDHPQRLYTVATEGRHLLNEGHRQGIAFGHATGDLGESSQHTLGVEAGRRYLETNYLDDPDSPVIEIVPYFEPNHDAINPSGNAERLDVVGLDREGEVVIVIEVERINNDLAEAAPADFDKIAACDPEEAIWITMTQSDGHRLLRALNDPADGEPRVTQTYAETTALQRFNLDTPGCTAIYPVTWIRDRIDRDG
ncbi:hypothetical protein N0B31_14845 [Salinirubellus salinus]|uniref:ATP-binding protein n=1 Tax=Salinirubellus salinus TaxID=1364945 RepID=A0A9E7R0P7_9EURY|nr:hypothetical protein [Salinirubellus salinus]UWM53413.1 hypothetical protein N0B31_14845 [Salinirubellus salinus]